MRGAGREVISRALFGLIAHSGQVTLLGKAPDLSSPQATLESGIGLVARDRTEESVAMNLTIPANTFLNAAGVGRSLLNLLTPNKEAEQAAMIGTDQGVSPNDPTLAIEALSGATSKRLSWAAGWR